MYNTERNRKLDKKETGRKYEEKAAEFFDGDDNSELAFLYDELTGSTRSKKDKVIQMKPIDTW